MFAPGSNYLTATLGFMSNMDVDTSTTAPELHSPMQATSPPVFEDRMSISSPISSPVYEEPPVALDDPFMSSIPTSQGSSPSSKVPRLDLSAAYRRRPSAVNEGSSAASTAYHLDRSTLARTPRVYKSRPSVLMDHSSFHYPNGSGKKTGDLNFTPRDPDCSSPTSSLFSATYPNSPVDGPDDSDNSASVNGQDDRDDSASVSLSQSLGNTEFNACFNDLDDSTHGSAASMNQRDTELESPLDSSDNSVSRRESESQSCQNVILFDSSGSWRRSMSSTPHSSVPSAPSRPRKVYVLYSPSKNESQRSPAAKKKHYSPQVLLQNMDEWDIEPIDSENEAEILHFFSILAGLRTLVKSRNKSLDKQPGKIPGYHGLLDNWVTQHAVEAIPSREAVSLLDGKVSLNFYCLYVRSLITSTLVKI